MNNALFQAAIKSIMESTRLGYGFLLDFIDTILNNDSNNEKRINHAVLMWDYKLANKGKQIDYFSSSTLNLIGVNKKALMDSNHPIVYTDSDVDMYVDNRFLWRDRFVVIPINQNVDNDDISVKGALMFLYNYSNATVDLYQLNTLYNIINYKKPIIYDTIDMNSFLDEYKSFDIAQISIGNKWTKTTKTLKFLSLCNSDKSKNYGIKYATYWKLNDFDNIENEPFVKEFDCYIDNSCKPKKSNTTINISQKHYINNMRKRYNEELLFYSYNDVKESLADAEYFGNLKLNEESLTVIVIPIIINEGVRSMDVCCLYVKDLLYTSFISYQFCQYVRCLIANSLTSINKKIESQMVTSIMNESFSITKLTGFYKNVSNIIAQYNAVEDCLIYIKGNNNNLFLASEEDINDPTSFKIWSYSIGSKKCYVPAKYCNDKEFLDFLSNLSNLETHPDCNASLFQTDRHDGVVKNAACVTIQNSSKNDNSGIIILINRIHNSMSTDNRDLDIMSVDNITVTYLSALYLHQFGNWNKANSQKNYLLKKLRHEIPHCARIIGDKLMDIKVKNSELFLKGFVRQEVLDSINTIELNRNRINMLASFFGAVDYENERFAAVKKQQDIIQILNANIPLFKEEACNKGVDVITRYHGSDRLKLNISDFYPLAIINVINNAIRYCSRGTNIIIDLYEDRIEVSDVGLPIDDNERDFIFDDGYRGSNAKDIDVQGIGYGLHISKRVVEAHGSSISVESEYLDNENYFLEKVIYNHIKSLSGLERENFIYATTEPHEKPMVSQLVDKISKTNISLNMEFINNNTDLIKKWLDYEYRNGGPCFIEMDENWFIEPIAKVTFIINFGNTIYNEENTIIG